MCASMNASSVSERNRREPIQPLRRCNDQDRHDNHADDDPSRARRPFCRSRGGRSACGCSRRCGAGAVDARALEDVGVCGIADSGGEMLNMGHSFGRKRHGGNRGLSQTNANRVPRSLAFDSTMTSAFPMHRPRDDTLRATWHFECLSF